MTIRRRTFVTGFAMSVSSFVPGNAEQNASDWPETPKGRVTLTASTVDRLRVLLGKVRASQPQKRWLASLIWAEQRGYKLKDEADWTYTGPGLEIGFYTRDQVPKRAVETFSGVEVVFVYPDRQFSVFDGKVVDFVDGRFIIRD